MTVAIPHPLSQSGAAMAPTLMRATVEAETPLLAAIARELSCNEDDFVAVLPTARRLLREALCRFERPQPIVGSDVA